MTSRDRNSARFAKAGRISLGLVRRELVLVALDLEGTHHLASAERPFAPTTHRQNTVFFKKISLASAVCIGLASVSSKPNRTQRGMQPDARSEEKCLKMPTTRAIYFVAPFRACRRRGPNMRIWRYLRARLTRPFQCRPPPLRCPEGLLKMNNRTIGRPRRRVAARKKKSGHRIKKCGRWGMPGRRALEKEGSTRAPR